MPPIDPKVNDTSSERNPAGEPNIRSALLWTSILSIVLAPFIIVGPFLAGYAGGRRARTAPAAIVAALGPALIWVGIWWWLSSAGIPVGKERIMPPADMFAPTTGLAILGGAFAGSGGKLAHVLGAAVLIVALTWFGRGSREFYNLYKHLAEKPEAETVTADTQNQSCPDRLKKLYDAARLYADSWDDQLPPADNWMSALRDPSQTFSEEEDLRCPEAPSGRAPQYGYAMNRALGGKRFRDIADPAKTPLFFDADDLALNANSEAPSTTRHGGQANVVFADGSAGRR